MSHTLDPLVPAGPLSPPVPQASASASTSATDVGDASVAPVETPPSPIVDPNHTVRLPPRRVVVSVACKACQRRKIRCDAKRPICTPCRSKTRGCEWEFEPGMSRYAALKSKNEKLEKDLSSLLELYWHIHTKSPEEAKGLYDGIRSNPDFTSTMSLFRSGPIRSENDTTRDDLHGQPNSMLAHGGRLGAEEPGNPSFSPHSIPPTRPPGLAEAGNSPLPQASQDFDPVEDSVLGVFRSPQAIPVIRVGFRSFFLCTATLFHIYSPAEGEALFEKAFGDNNHGHSFFSGHVFRTTDQQTLSSLGQICGMAAIGLRYTRDSIPGMGLPGSEDAGMFVFVNPLYRIAKRFLDETIEVNSLRAMKLCALLSLFNVIAHSSVALAYADLGIKLGTRHKLHHNVRPVGVSSEDFLDYKKVLRTLAVLRSWLVATLGYISSDETVMSPMVNWVTPGDLQAEEYIQQELGKLTVMKAGFLETISSFSSLSPLMLSSMRKDLAGWYEQLPPWMRLERVIEHSEITREQRRATLFVHMFYLSAVVLKSRAVHGSQLGSSLPYDSMEMRTAVLEGLEASRLSAQILNIFMVEDNLFKSCWLCIFQAYVSCLSLLYASTRRLLNNDPPSSYEADLGLTKNVLDVLGFCGTSDVVANGFWQTLKTLYDTVESAAKAAINQTNKITVTGLTPEVLGTNAAANNEYLFARHSADAPIYKTFCTILGLLSQPFNNSSSSDPDNLPDGAHLGTHHHLHLCLHVSSPFNGHDERCDSIAHDDLRAKNMAVSGTLRGIRSGSFLDSNAHYGWN